VTGASLPTRFVTRFAPSPTGYLHRGHAFSALTAFDAASAAQGQCLLRIEDIDTARCRPAFITAIEEDLAWLGLIWPRPVRRQSEHGVDYAGALARLEARGLIYRCFKTRQEVAEEIARAPHGPATAYRGAPLPAEAEARLLERGFPFAWRLSIAAAERALGGFDGLSVLDERHGVIAADPWKSGDVVLARKGLGVAYHLAVVVDDAFQGVTHVIRGDDLLEAAHTQRLLQALLDLPTPVWRHHPLILRPDGRRFAKRDQTETLRDLRARGVTPKALRADLGL
jgi:glutamyl-Q tRNA(Asp) synthetase